jgi:hypothetical protein
MILTGSKTASNRISGDGAIAKAGIGSTTNFCVSLILYILLTYIRKAYYFMSLVQQNKIRGLFVVEKMAI